MKKRFLAALLLLSMAVALASCTSNNVTSNVTSTVVGSVTDGENYAMKVPMAEDGRSLYKLVNTENISDENLDTLLDMCSELRSEFGINISRNTVKTSTEIDPSTLEILFGTVNCEHSENAYKSIGYDGYAVKLVENKIVIAAYTDESMKAAVNAFLSKSLVADKESGNVYYVNDVVYEGTRQMLFTDENPLSNYKIVYSGANVSVATKLSIAVEEYCGIDIPLVKDTAPETEYEIIIGDTNRQESKDANIFEPTLLRIKSYGKKIVMRTADDSFNHLLDLILEHFMYNSHTLNFPVDADEEIFKYDGTDKKELTEEANIRIMSFNILSEEWDSKAVLTPRIAGVVGCILYYKPDVVGIQEVSQNWHKKLDRYLSEEYVLINPDILGSGDNNYTMLAYRKDTVKLIESDLYFYSVGNSQRLRLINTGYFEHIESGKNFVVTSTHYNANHGGDNTPQRVIQATEFAEKVIEYTDRYKCPVISTGDFNCYEGSAPYDKMMQCGIIMSAKHEAVEKGEILATTHGLGSAPSASEKSIDHILYAGNVIPMYYSTLIDPFLSISSDHSPIIADFKFE